MVAIKRKGSPSFLPLSHDEKTPSWSPTASRSYGWPSPRISSPYSRSSTYKLSFDRLSHYREKNVPRWMVTSVYILAAISWVAALSSLPRREIFSLEHQERLQRVHLAEAQDDLRATKARFSELSKRAKELKSFKKKLEHERKMLQELNEDGGQVMNMPKNDRWMEKWAEQRLITLKRKAEYLKNYVQESSRRAVLDKYGPGPHFVKFTVEFIDSFQHSQLQSFVVQLVSVDEMPHTILLFLDMVSSKIWDDTVFLHHESVDHVIAAAPVQYQTHNPKFHNLRSIGWDELGFPEYSKSCQHEKFTLGFAGRGPGFFINSMDNADSHGPGKQGHHILPDDAEPCFGRIVKGEGYVDGLIKYGLHQLKMNKDASQPWAENEHSMTRIVSIELSNDS